MARTKRVSKARKGRRVQSKRVGKKRTKRSSKSSSRSNKRMRRSFIKKSRGRPRRSLRRMRGGSRASDEVVTPLGDTNPWSDERERLAGERYEQRYGVGQMAALVNEIRELENTLQRQLAAEESSFESKLLHISRDDVEKRQIIEDEHHKKIEKIMAEKPTIDAKISRKKEELDALRRTKDVDQSLGVWD
jgi:hypothetical protein